MKKFDVLIIGSGMGGLVCGDILSREGYSVCLVEKNKQFGGCLQIYARDKVTFDSGVHYLGGLEKGQNLYQIFKYLGLMDKLKLERMDEVFDRVLMDDDERIYGIAQGYGNFIQRLMIDFPEEEEAIRKYCDTMKSICDRFPMYRLRMEGGASEKIEVMSISAKRFIEQITQNEKLRAVLAGNNMLYVGVGEETPLYVHALIVNSYMESAWRCVNGGAQITKALTANIHAAGGVLIRNKEVLKLLVEDGLVKYALLEDGVRLEAASFVSDIPPAKTFRMAEPPLIRPVTRKRLEAMENTVSSFIINIVFKKDCYPYVKHNYYYHKRGSVWNMAGYNEGEWPLGYALYMAPSSRTREFADGMTIFAYMRYEEVQPWASSFNTVAAHEDRGADYASFKKRKAEQLLDKVEEKFPGLRKCIKTYYTSTPLSYRDYIGNEDGNLYGTRKDYQDPLAALQSAKTKVPNLYLTGQSLNLHGILGTAISGLISAAAVMGRNDFIEKIRNA
ncbi:MAG: NAD(P)/FAD-dependent oxidoreductase [Bacteroidota bacterium]|nr:NAD(P)/FAD-dependent oxidoreductase [Bacteroidota bacterium]